MRRTLVMGVLLAGACGGSHSQPTVGTKPIDDTGATASSVAVATTGPAEDDSQIPAWYDLKPLLANLRPDAVAMAKPDEPLEEVPLYDFDLSVHPEASAFELDERVFFQNSGSGTLADVMLRIFANTPPDGDPPERFMGGHCVGTPCEVKMVGRDVIVVHPARALAPAARLRIVLHIAGKLRTIDPSRTTMMAAATSSLKTMMGGGGGDQNGDYGLLASGDDILSFGNFYPVLARRKGDSDWDLDQSTLGDIGPDLMAHVHARIDLPAGYTVAASGAVAHDETKLGRRRLEINAGCTRDFAMLASPKFVDAEKEVDGVLVRSFFRESDRPTGERVLDVAAWSLRDFQKRFGPYPFRKLDLVEQALVAGAGGVEFAGLATVASMFYKPSGSPSGGGGGLEAILGMLMGSGGNDGPMKAGAAEFTTAHEVGHEWWHETVGSDSRLHPWQDEALAQFSAMLYAEDRYGAQRAKRESDMNARMAYQMMRMLGQPDGPVDVAAGTQSQMAYGGIVYGKGPYYLVALRKALGDKAFFGALQTYVKQYYLGWAPPQGLRTAMTNADPSKGSKVAALSQRWLEQAHGDEDLGKGSMDSILAMANGGQKPAGGGLGGLGALGGGGDMQQMMNMMQSIMGGANGGGGDMMKMLQQMLGGQ